MIPRRIIQLWVGPQEPPAQVQQFCDNTKRMNPDWSHTFHRNEVLERYASDPYVKHMISRGEKWAFVADRIRILLLRDEGGLYVDADAKPLRPLSSYKGWDMPHYDFLAAFRDPYRAGVSLHRGISFVDNTVMASIPNGRIINHLYNLYTSQTPVRNGHDAGVEVSARSLPHDTGWFNFEFFYAMRPTHNSLFDHDSINLGSWADKPHLQFATP